MPRGPHQPRGSALIHPCPRPPGRGCDDATQGTAPDCRGREGRSAGGHAGRSAHRNCASSGETAASPPPVHAAAPAPCLTPNVSPRAASAGGRTAERCSRSRSSACHHRCAAGERRGCPLFAGLSHGLPSARRSSSPWTRPRCTSTARVRPRPRRTARAWRRPSSWRRRGAPAMKPSRRSALPRSGALQKSALFSASTRRRAPATRLAPRRWRPLIACAAAG